MENTSTLLLHPRFPLFLFLTSSPCFQPPLLPPLISPCLLMPLSPPPSLRPSSFFCFFTMKSTIWGKESEKKRHRKQNRKSAAPALTKWLQSCLQKVILKVQVTSNPRLWNRRQFEPSGDVYLDSWSVKENYNLLASNYPLFSFVFPLKYALPLPSIPLLSFYFPLPPSSTSSSSSLCLSCLSVAVNTESVGDRRCVGSPQRRAKKNTHTASAHMRTDICRCKKSLASPYECTYAHEDTRWAHFSADKLRQCNLPCR